MTCTVNYVIASNVITLRMKEKYYYNDYKDSLERFVKAQSDKYNGYDTALREIKTGKKKSHWMWYIFPQLSGLGRSSFANYYAIKNLDEAEAYLADTVLGARLREISTEVLKHTDKSAIEIFGHIDSMKLRSCMTLFDAVSQDDVFAKVLNQFYDGKRCELTLKKLSSPFKIDIDALRNYVNSRWQLGDLHGLKHWDNVFQNGMLLASDNPDVNKDVVAAFAYLHDCERMDDFEDIYHGPRAAEFIVSIRDTLLKNLTDEEFKLLQTACREHTTASRTGNITIDTCFDSDRLDLERCGITTDPKLMASERGAYWAGNLDEFYRLIKSQNEWK